MTNREFAAWFDASGLGVRQLCKLLGISTARYYALRNGPRPVPKYIELAIKQVEPPPPPDKNQVRAAYQALMTELSGIDVRFTRAVPTHRLHRIAETILLAGLAPRRDRAPERTSQN